MSRLFFDLIVVMAVVKETWAAVAGQYLPLEAVVMLIIILPFLIGLTSSGRSPVIYTPVATSLRSAVACLSLVVFVALDIGRNTGGMSLAFMLTAVAPYVLGRGMSLVVRGLFRACIAGVMILLVAGWLRALTVSG